MGLADGNADARPSHDVTSRRPGLQMKLGVQIEEIDLVQFPGDVEGGGELAGPRQQVLVAAGLGTAFGHDSLTADRAGRANEDGGGFTYRVRHDVEHPVVAVGEINIGSAGGRPQPHVLHFHFSEGMASRLILSVSLHLYDARPEIASNQVPAEQSRGSLDDILLEYQPQVA